MIIKIQGVLNQPKIKADKTPTINVAGFGEMTEFEFQTLNKAFYNKEEVYAVICTPDKYADFIIAEANRLAKELEE